MRARTTLLLASIVLLSVLLAGCTGGLGTSTAPPANASRDLYLNEFHLGYGHHIAARDLFNNATYLWDLDDYTNASAYMYRAEDEYAQAEDHYDSMLSYAGDDSERAFAEGMKDTAAGMDSAASKYLMSIDSATAGDDSGALTYFSEGQAFVDSSMESLNKSLEIMPAWLEG
ncbi:MAG TPA: hypothetical protein VMC84_02790 [Methanocella sp.]|uniref:hypothetical protein n=1 Tax=Methanocella sp. TaxID=2052833 RepID=UPI002B941D40|nr:hypothetical protein [Methanocella sp.]HTY90080.1 hypothetical protein [Methanocella sp.]